MGEPVWQFDKSATEQVASQLVALASQTSLGSLIRDRMVARLDATDEVGMFPAQSTCLAEEVAVHVQRRRLAAEAQACGLLHAIVDRLIDPSSVREDVQGHIGIVVPTLERVKRVQSVVCFWSNYSSPMVIVGQRDTQNPRYKQALVLRLGQEKALGTDTLHADDLAAFRELAQIAESRQFSEAEIESMMLADGNLWVGMDSPGSVFLSSGPLVEALPGGVRFSHSRPVDLYRRGIRSKLDRVYDFTIRDEFAQGRLSESTIEQFKVPEHVADLVSVLAK